MLSKIKWLPDVSSHANSLRQESIHWSATFDTALALQEPVRAYNLMKLGIRYIEDVVNDQGYVSSFPHAMAAYNLGMHHKYIWGKISD